MKSSLEGVNPPGRKGPVEEEGAEIMVLFREMLSAPEGEFTNLHFSPHNYPISFEYKGHKVVIEGFNEDGHRSEIGDFESSFVVIDDDHEIYAPEEEITKLESKLNSFRRDS